VTFSAAASSSGPASVNNLDVSDRRADTSASAGGLTVGAGSHADITHASGTASGQNFQSNFRFNATGTNLALRQNVVITGTFLNAAPADREKLSSDTAQLRNRAALLPQSRIVGKAVTADGREFQLNAAPVLP
jgi:hypothetical protein